MDIILLFGAIFFGILGIIIITGEGYLDMGPAIILTVVIIGAGFMSWALPHLWERNRPPEDYYQTGEEYVDSIHSETPSQDRSDLINFLNQIKPLPPYNKENFTSFESSSRLEWILEGAGFETSLVVGRKNENSPTRAWVTVNLNGENITLDSLKFTKNRYDPPDSQTTANSNQEVSTL